jgi:hypothetical protein
VARESARLARARAGALTRCEQAKLKGKLAPASDCAAEPTSVARVTIATARFEAAIAKSCGGADRACGGDTAGEPSPGALGWPAFCPDFAGASCDDGVHDCGDLAICLECIQAATVADAAALTFGALHPTDPRNRTERALNLCQRAIGGAMARLLTGTSSALQQCWDRRLRGKHDGACPDAAAAPGTPARVAADKIAKASAAARRAICRACGGADRLCGGGDDLDPTAAIGFTPVCDAVTVPGGPSCGGAVETLGDLVTCLACVTQYDVACIDRAQVPAVVPYPPECVVAAD